MSINQITNGETASSVRNKLNATIIEANKVESKLDQTDFEVLRNRVDNLEENQYTGVEVYATYSDLPVTGVALTSYKVSNDPTFSLNGYYHWDIGGSVYVKDVSIGIDDEVIDNQTTFSSETIVNYVQGNNNIIQGNVSTSTNYIATGITRILGQQTLQDYMINKIYIHCGSIGFVKIKEVSKNEDGTFNVLNTICETYMSAGVNEFTVKHPNIFLNKINKGSYIAVYITNLYSGSISYGTGDGYSFVGEITGDNNVVISDPISVNVAIYGTTIGVQSLENNIEEIFGKKIYIHGNQLEGTKVSTINYVNLIGLPTENAGKITKINIKAISAGEVTLVKYKKLDSNNFEFKGMFAEIQVEIGDNTIDYEGFIEKDIYLGFFCSSATIAWKDNGLGYKASGYPTVGEIPFTVTTANFALNFEIEIDGLINIQENQHSFKNDNLEGVVFELKGLITSDYYNDGWVGTSSPADVNSFIYYNKPSCFDKWIARVEITLLEVTTTVKLVLCQGNGGIYVTFDLENNKIQIHSSWDGLVGTTPDVLVESTITGVTFTQNKTYILEVQKNTVETVIATVYDKVFTNKFSLSHNTTGDSVNHGDGNYPIGLLYKSGLFTWNNLKQWTPQNTSPRLLIYGDSYIVGYSNLRYGDALSYRYAQLIMDELGENNVTISAKGGEDSNGLLEKIETDLQGFRPKYTLLAIGLNDDIFSSSTFDEFKVNMSKLIEIIKKMNSIPILITYPRINGSGIAAQFNSWVRNYTGMKYVDFHLATSSSGTPGSPINASLFYADGHPNILGNQRYFDKFKLDCPYVFNDF